MAKKSISMPQRRIIPMAMHFVKEGEELSQYMSFRKPTKIFGEVTDDFNLPLGKALKGSIVFEKDPETRDGKRILQRVRVYKKTKVKATAPILETRYSRVSVSKSRVTITMSFPLCSDPQRLKARLQNFANIVVDESDEIAALLNQEGDARVQEAWQLLSNCSLEDASSRL